MLLDPRYPTLPDNSLGTLAGRPPRRRLMGDKSFGVAMHIILVWETGQKSYVGWDPEEGELFLSSRVIPGETLETWDIEWAIEWAYDNFPIHKGQRFAGENVQVP